MEAADALLTRYAVATPSGYAEEVVPQLGDASSSSHDDNDDDAKYAAAEATKTLANSLFKEKRLAFALKTYLVGVLRLQSTYDDPALIIYDVQAHPVCIATYSNAALMALKLEHFELAEFCCNGALSFEPKGTELQKVLLRKAQSLLERPSHSDPDQAVELLQRAAKDAELAAAPNRAVLEMLQRAKRAAKDKEKAASKALFGGKGLMVGGNDAVDKTDAATECDELLRRGLAWLLGTTPAREVDPYADAREEMLAGDEQDGASPPAKRDIEAARASFASAASRAKAAGLRQELAHAHFGQGAACSEAEEWALAVAAFDRYFELVAADEAAALREPVLGEAYGRLHSGLAQYNLHDAEGATRSLELYLDAKARYKDIKVCHTDAWGNETYPELEKELQRSRQWVVSGRVEFSARRHLARLKQITAAHAIRQERERGESDGGGGTSTSSGSGTTTADLEALRREAAEHIEACLRLAWEEGQRTELRKELQMLRGGAGGAVDVQ